MLQVDTPIARGATWSVSHYINWTDGRPIAKASLEAASWSIDLLRQDDSSCSCFNVPEISVVADGRIQWIVTIPRWLKPETYRCRVRVTKGGITSDFANFLLPVIP